MTRTFTVEIVKGGMVVITDGDGGVILAAGSPAWVAKEMKAIFEVMKTTASTP